MVCIAAELFESMGDRGGEERNMKSDRMRNKEKHDETERVEQSVREICSPSEGCSVTFPHGHIHNRHY